MIPAVSLIRWVVLCIFEESPKRTFCLVQTLSHLPVVEDIGETPEVERESHNDDVAMQTGESPETNDAISKESLDEGSHDLDEESHDPEAESHDKGVASVAIAPHRHKAGGRSPYGLPCVRELLRFLTSIINNDEK